MYKNKKILGFIPARGGSKGLVGKNIKNLSGTPLIGWTINQAKTSKLIDEIFVSTDDHDIADTARKHGVEINDLRPKELAEDNSKIIDVINHTIKLLESKGKKYDYLAILEPTSPLRKKSDIDDSIKKMIDNEHNADCLISVGEIALEHPIYAKKIDDNGFVKTYFESTTKQTSSLRQELGNAYFPYGVIYLSKISVIKETQLPYSGKILPYIIERWQNYEINDIYDFMCIEAIMNFKMGEII